MKPSDEPQTRLTVPFKKLGCLSRVLGGGAVLTALSCGGLVAGIVHYRNLYKEATDSIGEFRQAVSEARQMTTQAKAYVEDSKEQHHPCTRDQKMSMAENRKWVLDHHEAIASNFDFVCRQFPEFDCPDFSQTELVSLMYKLTQDAAHMDTFCPSQDLESDDGHVLAKTLNTRETDLSPQVAFYPAFWEDTRCEQIGTFVHELGHASANAPHEATDKLDWIYALDMSAQIICKEESSR